jgi:TRAP-type mannitol/chloroaromatic compound transport system substrate-binding protein
MVRGVRSGLSAMAGAVIASAVALTVLTPGVAFAGDIRYRSFSASAAIGPPAEAFAAKLQNVTRTALGASGEVHFVKLAGLPAVPSAFAGDIVSAVGAGEAGGGFDAAYISGGDLNKAWGFIYNSGVPFGPTFDEFLGFLYGKAIDNGQKTGLDLVQELLDARNRNVVALPIVGSPEQMSGYFLEPIGDVPGHRGIGLAGLCQQPWTLRYLPPGENVLNQACDDLVASHAIPRKNLGFIAAVPGGGSLVDGVMNGNLQGFEFATPLDDVSQVFNTPNNPGTLGLRYIHTPGWQQQFLLTWMVVNKQVWNSLNAGQQILLQTVARDHVLSSYGENMRQQGAALQYILDVNKHDGDAGDNMVLVKWPERDQDRLRDATIHVLNARASEASYSAGDRADYTRVLEALRVYVRANDRYWDHREVHPQMRFSDWANRMGDCWESTCEPRRTEPGRRW